MTTRIGHDNVVAAFQVVSHMRPALATIRDSVQQEDGRLIVAAGAVIMNGDAIGLHIAFRPCCHFVLLSFLGCNHSSIRALLLDICFKKASDSMM